MASKGTSCGKFILLGEHFVVSGEPALAFPLRNLKCDVEVASSVHPQYTAEIDGSNDLQIICNLMARAAYAIASVLRIDIASQPIRVRSRSNFPIAHGLGSSAAFSVAFARAFDAYRKSLFPEVGNATWDDLIAAADAVERIFHGTPSGLDAAVIFSERPIRFQNNRVVREISNKAADLVIVDGGERDFCGPLVSRVGEFRQRNPEQWSKMASHVRQLVDAGEKGLKEGDARVTAEAIRENHSVLAELGLSTPFIESLIQNGLSAGALAGKVSGAGGGGAVVFAAQPGEGSKLSAKLSERGYTIFAKHEAQRG